MKVRSLFLGFWRSKRHFLFDLFLLFVLVSVVVALHFLKGGMMLHALGDVLHAVAHFVSEVFSAEVVAGVAYRLAAVVE